MKAFTHVSGTGRPWSSVALDVGLYMMEIACIRLRNRKLPMTSNTEHHAKYI